VSRIAYVNGRYVPHREACVHIEDRGYQFADGVYEVCEVRGSRLVDAARHLDRLDRSLRALQIHSPMSRSALELVLQEVVRRNRVVDGLAYLQVTRGVAPRDHGFPPDNIRPGIVATARSVDPTRRATRAQQGVSVITVAENRWPRVDIKSIALLPNVLAKQAAREAGAFEAWFVDASGFVTEGSSTNAWIVTDKGTIVTRSADAGILKGVTRTALLEILADGGWVLEERPFRVEDAYVAREAFVTSATQAVLPVVRIDGRAVGDGTPGPVAMRLRRHYFQHSEPC